MSYSGRGYAFISVVLPTVQYKHLCTCQIDDRWGDRTGTVDQPYSGASRLNKSLQYRENLVLFAFRFIWHMDASLQTTSAAENPIIGYGSGRV